MAAHPDAPAVQEALGSLTLAYSFVEYVAAAGVWRMLDLGLGDGTVITSRIALKGRFELLVELAATKGYSSIVPEIVSIANEFDKKDGLTARRNRYIHGVIAMKVDDSFPSISQAYFPRPGGIALVENVKASDIKSLSATIMKCATALSGVFKTAGLDISRF